MTSTTGITNIQNMAPELPLQFSEDSTVLLPCSILSTPSERIYTTQKLISEESLGCLAMSDFLPQVANLDGSGIDPAPEIVVRSDIDADNRNLR